MGLSNKGRRAQCRHGKKKKHENSEHLEHTEDQLEEEKLKEVEETNEESKEICKLNDYDEQNEIEIGFESNNFVHAIETMNEMINDTPNEINDKRTYTIDNGTINEIIIEPTTETNDMTLNNGIDETNNETPKETFNQANSETPKSTYDETSNETTSEIFNQNDNEASNESNNDPLQFQPKPQITVDSDIFDQFIDQYKGERRKYLRATYFYGCVKNTYHFVSHLPIQRIFFPYFESAFGSALYFVGINGETKERNSIEELDILLENYIDQIDKKVDSSKDHSIDQLKYLKGRIIENPTFQSKIAPIIQSSYHTVSEISTKIPFLKS